MSLDWEIYRQLYQQSEDPMWGMFPYHSAGEIAKRLGVTRETIWRRIKELHSVGFWQGYEVIPNPRLLGVGLNYYVVSLPDPGARLRFLDSLEPIDGLFLAEVDFGARANVMAVSDLPALRARREKRLREVDGVESLGRPIPVWLPACAVQPSAEDWRFIQLLRQNPTQPLAQLAKQLGVSAKTAASRFKQLERGRAILGHPVENFARFPGTIVGALITLKPGVDAPGISRSIREIQPNAWEAPSSTRRPGTRPSRLGFMWLVQNPSETDRISAAVLRLPEVAEMETFFPGTYRSYRHWFDARVYEMVSRTEPNGG